MKLTINLARKSVTTMSDLIRPAYLEMDNGLEELNSAETLGFPAVAYIQRDKPTQPKWLNFLGPHFEVGNVQNTSTSFVLILEVHERIFAVTFGMSGYNSLERKMLEREFGLRVTANSVDVDEMTAVDTRNLDTVTRQQRTHLSTGSNLSDFSIPVEQDWVRRIQGKAAGVDFTKSLSGSDSLHINTTASLTQLPELLGELLRRYESEEYKKNFPFLDYYRPLEGESDICRELDRKLAQLVGRYGDEKMSIAVPQLLDDEHVSHFELTAQRRTAETDEVTLRRIYAFLKEYYEGNSPLIDLRIVPIADNGQPAGQRRELRDWIVCEIEYKQKTYVLSLGDWYEVDRKFVSQVNADIARIADISDELNLSEWKPSESEGDYNEREADAKGWLLLDKKNYYIGGPGQKIEICDLMNHEMDLICVKQQTSSATLSHLFSQGSVSAELYRSVEKYRERIFNDAAEKWEDPIVEPVRGPRIVYAIANDRPGELRSNLFFFSKVSLLFNARIIRTLGLRVAIARIGMPEGSLRKKKRKKKASSPRP